MTDYDHRDAILKLRAALATNGAANRSQGLD
jgi:hypothetical protein